MSEVPRIQIRNCQMRRCDPLFPFPTVGRKNFLFVVHPDAGWRSAVIYSVAVSCQRRGIERWQYLKDNFTRLRAAKTNPLAEFLPKTGSHQQPSRADPREVRERYDCRESPNPGILPFQQIPPIHQMRFAGRLLLNLLG